MRGPLGSIGMRLGFIGEESASLLSAWLLRAPGIVWLHVLLGSAGFKPALPSKVALLTVNALQHGGKCG